MNLVYVAVGSAAGGVARWLLGEALQRRLAGPAALFPAGTLVVNVSGSILLGALAVLLARQGDVAPMRLLLMVGFCGGYTTFSTFSMEAVRLVQQGATGLAALYVAGSVALALAGTLGGMLLMRALLGRQVA